MRLKRIFWLLVISMFLVLTNACKSNLVTNINSINESMQEGERVMYLLINGNKLTIHLESNASVFVLQERLKEQSVTFQVDDYGNFEKIGTLGFTLPRNDGYITAVPGDIILYQGNQISLFYGSNSWNYTRIGKIAGYTSDELKDRLGAGLGRLEVVISQN